MEIKPFGNQILIKPVEKKQIILSQSKNFCDYGVVTAIGDKVEKIKVGDTIGYTVWGLNHLEIDGIKHYFVPEDERFILGTFTLPSGVATPPTSNRTV